MKMIKEPGRTGDHRLCPTGYCVHKNKFHKLAGEGGGCIIDGCECKAARRA